MANDGNIHGLVPLKEMVKALRAELKAAIDEGGMEMLQFELGSVELEFNAVVTIEKTAGGKLSFHLFSLGAEGALGGKVSDQQTQKVKLVLNPFARDEEAPKDADKRRK